jgi:hypothetical protein
MWGSETALSVQLKISLPFSSHRKRSRPKCACRPSVDLHFETSANMQSECDVQLSDARCTMLRYDNTSLRDESIRNNTGNLAARV